MVGGPPNRPENDSSSRPMARAALKEEKERAAAKREAIQAADRTSPSVLWRPLDIGYWDETNSLDLRKNNWQKWLCLIQCEFDMMQIHDAMDYLNGTFKVPDADLEPHAYKNYLSNDQAIASFIKLRCAEEELHLVYEMPTAKEVWDFLKDRHTKHDSISRILALEELFSMRFDTAPGADLVKQWQHAVEVHERIQSMDREITEWDRLMAHVLSFTRTNPVLCTYFSNQICIAARSDDPEKVFNEQDIERRLRQHMQLHSLSTNAHIFTTDPPSRRSNKCTNCKKRGHAVEFCIKSGGGMAGHSLEDAQRAKEAARKPKSW